jgi:hypothetical protein
VTPDVARVLIRANTTAIAATAVARGDADAMLCGLEGRFNRHIKIIRAVIGLAPDALDISAVNIAILNRGFYFFADTYVTPDPSAQEIADLTRQVAALVRRFRIDPKIALLSHSSFGSAETPSAEKMRQALQILLRAAPALEVEGEMHGDAALDEELRGRIFPDLAAQGRGERVHHAQHRCRQHRLSTGQDPGRGDAHRPDPGGRRQALPHSHPLGHRPRRHQHDRHCRRRGHPPYARPFRHRVGG